MMGVSGEEGVKMNIVEKTIQNRIISNSEAIIRLRKSQSYDLLVIDFVCNLRARWSIGDAKTLLILRGQET